MSKGEAGVSNNTALNYGDSFTEDATSEQSDVMLLYGGNLGNIVQVSYEKLPCLCFQQKNDVESVEMVECAMYTQSPVSSPATTTFTGSCFIILSNACPEQCSRFLCVHGRGGNSTSSIENEIDISDQGNSVVGESFPKILSSGDSRVHSSAVQNCCNGGNSQQFCDLSKREREKCPQSLELFLQGGASVHAKFLKNFDRSVVSSELKSDVSFSENVCIGSTKKYVLKDGNCAVIDYRQEKLNELKYLRAQQAEQKQSLQRKNQVGNRENVLACSGNSFTRKTVKKLTADCGEENQCELSSIFEASNRLKRLEEHFKGLGCTKKLYKDAAIIVNKDNNCSNKPVVLKASNETCLQHFDKCTQPNKYRFLVDSALLFNADITNFQANAIKDSYFDLSSNVKDNGKGAKNCLKVSKNTLTNTHIIKKVGFNVCDQNKALCVKNSIQNPSVELGNILVSDSVSENKKEGSIKSVFECQSDSLEDLLLDEHSISDSLPDLLSSTCVCTSQSEFDVRHLSKFTVDHALECYYEFDSSSFEEDSEHSSFEYPIKAVSPYFRKPFRNTMRELNRPLRGLLKKPNRPPPVRKNRVVFDETRNEFFEADYIILIREDCAYDEEDEEPCTCGEHELIRLCCEEGCQCNYNEENRTPQSPKYAPPMEFVDEAALSPPEGYKDNGLKNAISGALGGHVFGAQHIQQLQVIQRLQQQRAAMLAARASTQQQPDQQPCTATEEDDSSIVCTECAECVECASKQIQESAHIDEEIPQLSVPAVAIIPLHNNSPERRVTQKEIIAGEERPKYLLPNQHKSSEEEETEKIVSIHKNQRYVVETITMTTVTERRIVREATKDVTSLPHSPVGSGEPVDKICDRKPEQGSTPTHISGILKGGKLWKHEQPQVEDSNNTSSEEDTNLKRSVRFVTEAKKDTSREVDGKADGASSETENPVNELIAFKKHSSLFNNALRPNSALRQLFPTATHPSPPAAVLTHETLRAFDEAKRGNPLMSSLLTPNTESDTIRRTIERNALRRSLIRKKSAKSDISLEERIKQLTCDIEESAEEMSLENSEEYEKSSDIPEIDRRGSPTGEENPSQVKYIPDKSFSPSSSASSSSSGSTSAYKKISNVFNREKRQDKIPETDENPIVIIPQECRCPAAPDLGMGVQVPAAHTQIHQTPPRQTEPRRQFLSTLAPLTACVAGQKDDFSYYTLATGERNSNASTQCSEYNLGDIESPLLSNDSRKVAPDVIAGTPGQEQDELAAFATQEANRTEKIKKRYSNESNSVPNSNASSDDDEQNDYGFNKRPSVRGIKPKFSSTNEIIQQMQAQLNQPISRENTAQHYSVSKNPSGTNNNKIQHNLQHATVSQQQSERSWSFYADAKQRLAAEPIAQHPNYYQAIPTAIKHTFHGHEESLTYQNCHSSVTMEQHYGRVARSPTRRPESPPPLRNYHQTMVLIPYNTESYTQFSSQDPKSSQQLSRHNILEYQQVTQQTIRVPISYALPGMQLHVVTGRGSQPQYLHNPIVAPRTYNFQQDNSSITYCERGVPEGAPASGNSDWKNLISPTASTQQNCTQTTNPSTVHETVLYAMNV